MGSFVQSDKDKGKLILSVRNGDALLLKTGLKNTNQLIRIVNDKGESYIVPLSTDWKTLSFDFEDEVEKRFVIEFLDQGDGWGEWSSIALKE